MSDATDSNENRSTGLLGGNPFKFFATIIYVFVRDAVRAFRRRFGR